MCCTVRGDLIAALGRLLTSGIAFDRVVIETSGLADPAPVIQSFILDEVLRARFALDAIVTVVDARHLALQLAHDEAREQIAFADVILLNKVDLERPSGSMPSKAKFAASIRSPAFTVRLAATSRPARSSTCMPSISRTCSRSIPPCSRSTRTCTPTISAASRSAARAQWMTPRFNRWLNTLVVAQGRDLLRLKGVLHIAGQSRRFVFHGVHMTLDGRPGRPWKPGESA